MLVSPYHRTIERLITAAAAMRYSSVSVSPSPSLPPSPSSSLSSLPSSAQSELSSASPSSSPSPSLSSSQSDSSSASPSPSSSPSPSPSPSPAFGKRKASNGSLKSSSKPSKRRRLTVNEVEYDSIRAIVFTYSDHGFEAALFDKEIQSIVDLFENQLGVEECVQVKLHGSIAHMDMSRYAQFRIDSFKESSTRAKGKVLHLVYFGGHGNGNSGSDRKGLRLSPGCSTDQSLPWDSLHWNRSPVDEIDTVVFLDCCHAGLATTSSNGYRELFAACSGTSTTSGPGRKSFTDLLVRAGWSFVEPFTMSEWVDKTTMLAFENDCVMPVHASFGVGRKQICFRRQDRMAKEKKKQRASSLFAALNAIVALNILDDKELPSREEVLKIESDSDLVEPFTPRDVYRALRRVKDREIERKLRRQHRKGSYSSPGGASDFLRNARRWLKS